MVSKTTKYERKQADRFTRREHERRERFRRFSNQELVDDMCKPVVHALITIIDEFTLIDEDTIRAYLQKHKSVRKENNDASN